MSRRSGTRKDLNVARQARRGLRGWPADARIDGQEIETLSRHGTLPRVLPRRLSPSVRAFCRIMTPVVPIPHAKRADTASTRGATRTSEGNHLP